MCVCEPTRSFSGGRTASSYIIQCLFDGCFRFEIKDKSITRAHTYPNGSISIVYNPTKEMRSKAAEKTKTIRPNKSNGINRWRNENVNFYLYHTIPKVAIKTNSRQCVWGGMLAAMDFPIFKSINLIHTQWICIILREEERVREEKNEDRSQYKAKGLHRVIRVCVCVSFCCPSWWGLSKNFSFFVVVQFYSSVFI